jgi:hypothetical protein
MRKLMRTVAPVVALAVVAACSDEEITTPTADIDASLAGNTTGWDLPASGASFARAFPGRACMDAAHREFDFWVGEWNVFDQTETIQTGTNLVLSLLDGCLVQENWAGSGGDYGRSLNVYDAETGLWNQSWVYQFPGLTLRTSGGLDADGVMVLEDDRRLTGGGATIFDTWLWEELEPGKVRQTGITDIPDLGINFAFVGIYIESDDVTPVPTGDFDQCENGGFASGNRDGDFMVGSYTVVANDAATVGTAEIFTDLEGCVFEEQFSTGTGLEAIAFTYFDPRDAGWHRIYVDSEGERVEVEGGLVGDAIVMTGTEHSRGRLVDIRITIAPTPDGISQVWEVSTDGGVTWKDSMSLDYLSD